VAAGRRRIERGIANGTFASGEKLPGETEIAENYRVNRHTVRRALATWPNAPGAPRARQRDLCRSPALAIRCARERVFSEIVGAGGQDRAGQLIERRTRSPTEWRGTGPKSGAPLIRIEALRLADRNQSASSTSWLSANAFRTPGTIFSPMPLDDQVLAHYASRLSPRVDPDHRGDPPMRPDAAAAHSRSDVPSSWSTPPTSTRAACRSSTSAPALPRAC